MRPSQPSNEEAVNDERIVQESDQLGGPLGLVPQVQPTRPNDRLLPLFPDNADGEELHHLSKCAFSFGGPRHYALP